MNEQALQLLYDEISSQYDVGSFEDFIEYLSDEGKKKAFFEEVIKPSYDVQSIADFDEVYGLKKKDFISENPELESELDRDFSGTPIFKFLSDAVGRGVAQGNTTDETLRLMMSGSSATEDEVNQYIKAVQEMESYTPSESMIQFQKDYINKGGDTSAFLSALWNNIEVAPEILLQSYAGMVSAATTAEGAALASAGAGTGAGIGSFIPGVGTIIGGITGGMAAANGALETATSLTEFLKEKLDEEGKEFNAENVRGILNDEDSFSDIRIKALKRGGIISLVDLIGSGVAGRATKGISEISKMGSKATKLAQVGTGLLVEGLAGGGGEAGARLSTGQEMDAAEIGLEAIAGLTTAPISVIGAMKQSTYKINGQTLTRNEAMKIAKEDPEFLANANIEIKNADEDEKLLKSIQNKEKIKKNLPKNTPQENIDQIVELEQEAKDLSKSDSVLAKQRLSEITEELRQLSKPSKERKEQLSLEQRIQDFARRVSQEGKENLSDDDLIFYAEHQEDIDAAVVEGNKNVKRDKSRIRRLAQKIYSGSKEFDENDIDLYSRYEEEINNQIETISKTERPKTREEAYTLPTDPKEARKDFDIIDNRDGSTTEVGEDGVGKWIVVNNKTGKLVETKSKRDAEILARNPEGNWDYGEGDTIEVDIEPVIGSAEAKNIIESLKREREKKTYDVYAVLKDQLRLERRAAREKKYSMDEARKNLAEKIKEFVSSGSITSKQALSLVNKISNVNLDNPLSVIRIESYAEKLFGNAENSKKLNDGSRIKGLIKKVKKEKIEATVKSAIKDFLKIDVSLVENIDEYNQIALNVLKGIRSTRKDGSGIKLSSDVNLSNLNEYINKELPKQTSIKEEAFIKKYKEITGEEGEGLSYDEMRSKIREAKDDSKESVGTQMEAIKKAFEEYSQIIKEITDFGRGAPEVEDVYDVTDRQKSLIKKFTEMDLDLLTPKEAIEALDALKNYAVNQTTGGMEKMYKTFEGKYSVREMLKNGFRGYNMSGIGRVWGEKIASLNILTEYVFRGISKGLEFMQKSGVQEIVNGNAKALKDHDVLQEEYTSVYLNKKANNESFNSSYNIIERGMLSFAIRNLQGTIQQQINEFNRRKNLLKQSIDALKNQGGDLAKKGELYEKAYNKIIADSATADDVVSKTDSTNAEAVNWWIDKWAEIYPDLYDVSLNVYNKLLSKDVRYTPDFYARTKTKSTDEDLLLPGFEEASENVLYDKESRTLKDINRPQNIDGKNISYVDLNFDRANLNAYKNALVDINTASGISKVNGFVNDDAFVSMISNDEVRDVLKRRIYSYVRNIKGGNRPTSSDMKSINIALDKLASFNVGRALGGPTQYLKQLVPIVNTLINAGDLSISDFNKPGALQFILKSGYGIASRGFASISEIDNLNDKIKSIQRVDNKVLNTIEDANKWMLKKFVQNPDRYAAQISWLTYYIKNLKEQGFNTENIDWETHSVNKQAGDYAQQQVDRQQNVSDIALQGELFSSRNTGVSLARKLFFPFMNFAMNQKSRMYSDVLNGFGKYSSDEDKAKAKISLAGLVTETIAFNALGVGLSMGLYAATKSILGSDEEPEDQKKRVMNILKGRATNIASDIFSPVPKLTDPLLIPAANFFLESVQEDENPFTLFSKDKQTFFDQIGVFGIVPKNAKELYELMTISATGKYTNNYGKVVELDDNAREIARNNFIPKLLYSAGLAPVEVGTMANYTTKELKRMKKSKSGSKGGDYRRTYRY